MEQIGSYVQEFKCGQKKEIIEARCSCGNVKSIQKQRYLLLEPNATCGACPSPETTSYIAINTEGTTQNEFDNYDDAVSYSKLTHTTLKRVQITPIVI